MKKGFKRFLAISLAVVLAVGLTTTALAASGLVSIQISYRNGITVKLNGAKAALADANGKTVEPFIYNGSTYLPLRSVSEALGLDVDWDASTSTVSITGGHDSYTADADYDVIPISMTMQAGYQEYNSYTSGFKTIHAGIGYIDPLGEGHYYAGVGYNEIAGNEEGIYVSDWMDANFGCSLFCVYSLPDGDIYAWDGIYGANAKDMANYMSSGAKYTADQVNGSTPTRTDALINIIVGGTGAYKGATGVLVGSTSGGGVYGTNDGMTLPQTLFKLMNGYIKIPKDASATSTHKVTQEISKDNSALEVSKTNYAMVNCELRLQSGAQEASNKGAGTGVGTMLPFNANAMTSESGNSLAAASKYPVANYVNNNWLDAYGTPTFMVYHINDGTVAGDLYGWQFSYGTMLDETSKLSTSGTQNALFTLIVDGTGDFKGTTGILTGHEATSNPANWGTTKAGSTPLCDLSLLSGYLKVPSASKVVTAGGYANDTITD